MKIAFVLWMMWIGWGNDLSVAQQEAKGQHKLILLNFWGRIGVDLALS
jgi:hypothetical protein